MTIYQTPYDVPMIRSAESFKRDIRKHINRPLPELIHNVTGFGSIIISPDHNAGAYCSISELEIAVKHDCDLHTVIHEMAHAWQYMDGMDVFGRTLLSTKIEMEQQAEGLALQTLRDLFGYCPEPDRWAYFNKSDMVWLGEYYGEWVEDDMGILTHS